MHDKIGTFVCFAYDVVDFAMSIPAHADRGGQTMKKWVADRWHNGKPNHLSKQPFFIEVLPPTPTKF